MYNNDYPQGIILSELLTASEIITGADSGATATVSTVNNPEIEYYSGDSIYVENRAPITRASDQTENIKLIIEF